MEKSKIIILIIGLLIIVAAVMALVFADAKNDTVLTIGKDTYTLDDFKSYGKIWYYEQNTSLTEDIDEMLSQYASYKVFYRWAEKAGVTLNEDEMPAELESGDEIKLMEDYELTSGEYMRVQKEMALANKLYSDAYKLGKVPSDIEDEYTAYITYYSDLLNNNYSITLGNDETLDDYKKMVDYRVFEVALPTYDEESESGDESGDVSGDKKTSDKLNAKLRAQEVIANIKEALGNGVSAEDAFTSQDEDLYDTSRYGVSVDGGYTLSQVDNGSLATISKLYAKKTYTGSLIYAWGLEPTNLLDGIVDAIMNVEKGEFSEIFETDDSIAFVYIEDIRDGLEGADLDDFRNNSANYYISINSETVSNRAVARRADFDKLPAVIAQKEAEKASEEDTSGEIILDEGIGPDDIVIVPGEVSGE